MVCAAGAVALAQRAPDAQQALAAASAAMGTVRTLQFSGSGSDFVLGQHYDPASPWPRFTVKSFTRQIDYDRVILCTGFGAETIPDLTRYAPARSLDKPFRSSELIAAVAGLVAASGPVPRPAARDSGRVASPPIPFSASGV